MLKIALTGPSGSGKGYIAALLAQRGIPCLDTDRTVHRLYRDPAFSSALAKALGADVLCGDGTVDRKKLGALVFADAGAMEKLSHTVYPAVKREIDRFFEDASSSGVAAAAVDAPQLFEAGFENDFDLIVCVTAPKDLRLKRVIARDGITRKEALLRFAHQMPAREYERRSTVTLRNAGGDPAPRIDAILKKYGATDGC